MQLMDRHVVDALLPGLLRFFPRNKWKFLLRININWAQCLTAFRWGNPLKYASLISFTKWIDALDRGVARPYCLEAVHTIDFRCLNSSSQISLNQEARADWLNVILRTCPSIKHFIAQKFNFLDSETVRQIVIKGYDLKSLDLSNSINLSAAAIRRLLEIFHSLQELDLRSSNINDALLAEIPHISPQLLSLSLNSNARLSTDLIASTASKLKCLRHLDISNIPKIGDRLFHTLLESNTHSLTSLLVRNTSITAPGLFAFTQMRGGSITRLDISKTRHLNFDIESLRVVAFTLSNLQSFTFSFDAFYAIRNYDEPEVIRILSRMSLTQLTLQDLRQTHVSATQTISKICELCPGLRVTLYRTTGEADYIKEMYTDCEKPVFDVESLQLQFGNRIVVVDVKEWDDSE